MSSIPLTLPAKMPVDGPLSLSSVTAAGGDGGLPPVVTVAPAADGFDPFERTMAVMLQLLWERGPDGDIDQRMVEARGGDPLVLRDGKQRAKAISEAQRRYAAARAA